jgi:GTP cyclohydrolase II
MQNGLAPSPSEIVARARADLRLGLPVLLAGAGAATLAAAVETLSEARFAALPRPLILALTARRAQTLKIAPYDGDLVRVAVPDEADLAWVRAVADPADDLDTPLMGPFHALRGGDAGRKRQCRHPGQPCSARYHRDDLPFIQTAMQDIAEIAL